MCESLEYSNQGRRVTAVYSFARKDTLHYSLPS
ncbi:response regulator [Vibrio cholerae]|nr:response regulator [Vibrio cholerae]